MKNQKSPTSSKVEPDFSASSVFRHRPDFFQKHLKDAPNKKIILDLLELEDKLGVKK